MINSEEILEKLRKGEDLETIGKQIAAVLNLANDKYQKEQEEKNKKIKRKQELITTLNAFITWYSTYYNNSKPVKINTEEIAINLIDTLETLSSVAPLEDWIKLISANTQQTTKVDTSLSALVDEFLRDN